MKYHLIKMLIAGSLITMSGCAIYDSSAATETPSSEPAAVDFAAAWDAAEAKRKEASKMGAEWRDTGKMLKQAKKAAEEGDDAKAMKLVAQAMEQSEDAIAQYQRESKQWKTRVPQ